MAEISALTPSPPGLGDTHIPQPLPNSSEPHPHPVSPKDLSPQTPKSALYGDPAVKSTTWRGAKEPARDGKAPPPAPPKPPPRSSRGVGAGTEVPSCDVRPLSSETQPSDCDPAPSVSSCSDVTLAAAQPLSTTPTTSSDSHLPAVTVPAAHTPPLGNTSPRQLPPQTQSPSTSHCSPIPIVQEPQAAFFPTTPLRQPAPDSLSYLESASLMSGTMESLSGIGDDTSSLGSDSEVNGMVMRRTDKYGFLGGNQYTETGERDVSVDVARQREMKWLEMFANWDKWVSRRFQKVKLRCRKGVPSSLRARAWQLLSNSQELLETNSGKFEELEREPGDPKWLDIIEKDLHRQFPFHEMFAARGGHGQQDLYRILKAYTVYRPDEGYCQAQAPVAAVLLMHMPAEQAFWCLVQICEKYLPGYYSAGLEAIQLDGEIFFSLLRRVCPMAYRHLKKFKIDPILYMTEWFMCIFSRTLPWSCVLRVWDMFFCEGVKIVFRVGLVLLKQMLGSVDKLREVQGMYETMDRLRNIPPESVREDLLVHEVITMPVSEALIERESSIQVRKWRESRGELSHQPRRRLHGTRAIHELKMRAAAISSGGSFSYLPGSAPLPGPLRASSSLLSLQGFRKPKPTFRPPIKKGAFVGFTALEPEQYKSFQSPPFQAQPLPPQAPSSPGSTVSALAGSTLPAGLKSVPTAEEDPVVAEKGATPPQTLMASPRVVSEHITPTLPSPAANNVPLPLVVDGGKSGASSEVTAGGAGEEEGKKKKKGKEEKKKEKEEEKQRVKEKKERERQEKEKERQEKEKERQEKERQKKKKERGGKKKEKGGGKEEE
uniref:TBC1 domain family member 10B n=1 Tax=Paramormyrops kingsleyae TaxID=1676925 RepID=A0A3B3TE99_9TELE|nr:TBC1 domain family member 10B [Paramormyrops kingsleyae]